jgi:threonine/homoserine efflux transporter RhtA
MSVRTYSILLALEPAAAVAAGVVYLSQQLGLQGYLAILCTTVAAIVVAVTHRPNN